MTRVPLEALKQDLFWSKVDKAGEESCWDWVAGLNSYGYGQFQIGKRPYGSHRISYSLAHGDIPDHLRVDHLCHNTKCVNPRHLRLVTPGQNSQNRSGATRISKTGVRGVSLTKSGKYMTHVKVNGKRYCPGTFETLEEAAKAVFEFRRKVMTHTQN